MTMCRRTGAVSYAICARYLVRFFYDEEAILIRFYQPRL
jgi:hypothetical protein